MARKSFGELLQSIGFDVKREFSTLWHEFYGSIADEFPFVVWCGLRPTLDGHDSLASLCDTSFPLFPTSIRRTFRSLFGYNQACGIRFAEMKSYNLPTPTFEEYLLLCEYIVTMLRGLVSSKCITDAVVTALVSPCMTQVEDSLSCCGYMMIERDLVYYAVPENAGAIRVAMSVEQSLASDIMQYEHRTNQGNIDSKRGILNRMAHFLEARRDALTSISPAIDKAIFNMVNQLDVRHNNTTIGGPKYKPFAASLSNEQLEHWYDNLYHLSIAAIMAIECEVPLMEYKNKQVEMNQGV